MFDTSDMQLALKDTQCASSSDAGFHISTSFLKKNDTTIGSTANKLGSFTSVQTSSYQLHFENDDEVLKPDDDFVNDDWDE
jgi:hypothetical protein